MMQNFNLIKNTQNRRCRPETLLRLLISTSYPQATFSELSLLFTEAVLQLDVDDEDAETNYLSSLESDATHLRSIEKTFDMLDFIRCIDISKYEDSIKLRFKVLDFDPNLEKIVDSKNTHVVAATVTLDPTVLTEPHLELITNYLLKLFHNTQRKSKHVGNLLTEVKWRCRTRIRESADIPNTTTEDTKPTLDEVKDIVKTSLSKDTFNLILTQNALLLSDQSKRIWFQR